MADFVRDKGVAAFGTRLRRLSERLDREVQALYRGAALDFEPRWFPVVAALGERGPATVGELADALGVTHASVSQVRSALAARDLVRTDPDPRDQRRQIVQLTDAGQAAIDRLRPLWTAIAGATTELCDESPALLAALDALEAALARKGLAARAHEHLSNASAEIQPPCPRS